MKFFKLILFFTLVIYLISNVYALGITPARTTIDFEKGLKRTVDFEIINSEGKEMSLVIDAQGELEKYITPSSKEIKISASEKSKKISYEINLPNGMSPGLHTGEVVVRELPGEGETSEAFVQATLAVATQLHVYVPIPGKHANARMNIIDADKDGEVTFVFPIVSEGEFDLASVKANVDIFNNFNEKVASFNTETISIPSKQKKELVYKWKAEVPVGEYRAVANLIYDGEIISFEQTFNVGKRNLDLQDIWVDNFVLGQIAKIQMLVENTWSQPIGGAHIETKVFSDSNEVLSDFKSSEESVDGLSKKVFLSYWDTSGFKEGTYKAEVKINYANEETKKNLEFQVTNNKFTVIGLGYVISSDSSSGGGNSLVFILIIVIVILVLINIIWFMVIRKRLKK